MACIVPGPIVSDLRGSIGGCSFSKNAYGKFARARVPTRTPWATNVQTARSNLARECSHWLDMDPSDRSDWTTYGKTVTLYNSLGYSYHPSGLASFLRYRTLFDTVHPAPRDTRPDLDGLPSSPTCSIDFSVDDLMLHSVSPALAADSTLFVRALYPKSQSRAEPAARSLARLTLDSVDVIPFTIFASYKALLPTNYEARAWVALRYVDAAQRTGSQWLLSLAFTATG